MSTDNINYVLEKEPVATTTDSSRTFVIGDIHGAALAFDGVLNQLQLKEEDKIILLGDYIDGYPDFLSVIKIIDDLSSNYEVISLLGNHDNFARTFFNTGIPHTDWKRNGGKHTLSEFKKVLSAYPEMYDYYSSFFNSLHLYYIDDNNNLFVHAGFEPTRSLTDNKIYFGERIFYWDRDLIKYARNKSVSISNKVDFIPSIEMFKEIYVGHTTTGIYSETKPLNFLNLWMMDTGAGWEGKLSAMDINTKEVFQSDYSKNYYPDWKHE